MYRRRIPCLLMKSTASSNLWLVVAGVVWAVMVLGLIAGLILVPRMSSDDDGGDAVDEVEAVEASPVSTTVAADPIEIDDSVTIYELAVVGTYPHDETAYTQGLEFHDDQLLESTGLEGQSSLRLVEPESGRVTVSVPVDETLFAEGVTVVDGEAWQLTWRAGLLLIYSLDDLQLTGRITYDGEGWGLCATDEHLIMSDGSAQLTFRDRQTFAVIESVTVTDEGQPVDRLNELECVDDTVWANVWKLPVLLAIDRASGRVTGRADLSPLLPPEANETDNVANGVAFDPDTGNLWLTGKRWSVMYEVELQPAS